LTKNQKVKKQQQKPQGEQKQEPKCRQKQQFGRQKL
jgi:hypothetical protein